MAQQYFDPYATSLHECLEALPEGTFLYDRRGRMLTTKEALLQKMGPRVEYGKKGQEDLPLWYTFEPDYSLDEREICVRMRDEKYYIPVLTVTPSERFLRRRDL